MCLGLLSVVVGCRPDRQHDATVPVILCSRLCVNNNLLRDVNSSDDGAGPPLLVETGAFTAVAKLVNFTMHSWIGFSQPQQTIVLVTVPSSLSNCSPRLDG